MNCPRCLKIGLVACGCGAVLLAPLHDIKLPPAHAVGQMVGAIVNTTSGTATVSGVSISRIEVIDNNTGERRVAFWQRAAAYGACGEPPGAPAEPSTAWYSGSWLA